MLRLENISTGYHANLALVAGVGYAYGGYACGRVRGETGEQEGRLPGGARLLPDWLGLAFGHSVNAWLVALAGRPVRRQLHRQSRRLPDTA